MAEQNEQGRDECTTERINKLSRNLRQKKVREKRKRLTVVYRD